MKKTFGTMVSSLRKDKGMTQLELAEKMGVTEIVDATLKGIGLMGISISLLKDKTDKKENE